MKKIDIKKIVICGIGVVLMLVIGYGIYIFVQHVNGTSPSQIESRRRANDAADQTSRELQERGQWYQEMMSEPVTVVNSEGDTITYHPTAAPVINSNQ